MALVVAIILTLIILALRVTSISLSVGVHISNRYENLTGNKSLVGSATRVVKRAVDLIIRIISWMRNTAIGMSAVSLLLAFLLLVSIVSVSGLFMNLLTVRDENGNLVLNDAYAMALANGDLEYIENDRNGVKKLGIEGMVTKWDDVPYHIKTESKGGSKVDVVSYGSRNMWVYTPAGYNPSKKYDVLITLHGDGGTGEDWLVKSKANGVTGQQILDNAIAHGDCNPMIVVSPTITTNVSGNYQAAANQINGVLRNGVLPTLISKYSTYASTMDEVKEQRMHFGIIGLSAGSIVAETGAMRDCLDLLAYFGSCSCGGIDNNGVSRSLTNGPEVGFFYSACGDADLYVSRQKGNYAAYLATGKIVDKENGYQQWLVGGHNWSVWYTFFYNCLITFF